MELIIHAGVALLAYLLGSIPTGYLVGKARGIDVRAVGSGNIGATNVFRLLGKGAGILVLTVDLLKGFFAVLVTVQLAALWPGAGMSQAMREQLTILAGICAVLGHNYTCWLRFKGGKGIATSAGVLLAWVPGALLIAAAAWLLVLAMTRYVSLASVSAAAFLPLAVWLTRGSKRMLIMAVVLGALAIYKHRANLQRLWRGTEHRLGSKPPSSAPHPTR